MAFRMKFTVISLAVTVGCAALVFDARDDRVMPANDPDVVLVARPDTPAPSTESAGVLEQGIGVTIEPGPLALTREPEAVVFTRVGSSDRFTAVVRHVRITELRGTHAPWHVALAFHERGSPGPSPMIATRVRTITAFAARADGFEVHRSRGAFDHELEILDATGRAGNGAFDLVVDAEFVWPGQAADVVRADVGVLVRP